MGTCTMRFISRLLMLVMILVLCQHIGRAQSPTYGVGRTPSPEEVRAWDIAISPTGQELPPGHGTAKEGAPIFAQKCAACHGAIGSGGRAPTLIRRQGAPQNAALTNSAPAPRAMAGMQMGPPCLQPCVSDANVIALHSPYATVIWDYISRGMPLNKEGTLTPDEAYALTAFLLYKNGVIQQEDEVMDAQSLPKVKMPNLNGFALPPDWKPRTPRLQGY
jgi:S-disulfanyl-L-cysteine oxidoreductase SoxD